jgi:heme O synthase-like polyprenyltransferase
VGLIIGSILGSVLPPVVVYSQTRSRKDLGFTALGGVVGVVPPIIGYAVTADAVRDVYEAINSFSELWSLLFDPEYSRSCTGMLPGGILR